MTAALFRKTVLEYSHLPGVFLAELARVADRIPEAQQEEILGILETSAKHEVEILSKGYKVIADAEKKVRKQVEQAEQSETLKHADQLLNQSSSLSV